jgi:hypothetical protein
MEEEDEWKKRTNGRRGRMEEEDEWKKATDGRRGRMEGEDGWKERTDGRSRFGVSPVSRPPLIRGPLPFEVSFDSLEQICSP